MDKTREYREYLEQQQRRTTGIVGDLQRLKSEGNATAAELREFLKHLKGRSPKEVMGVVAESELIRSTVVATVGCLVLLVVFTLVPYALWGRAASSTPEKPTAAAVTQPTNEEPTAAVEQSPGTSEQAAATSAEPDLERAARAMGIGDAAEADPNSNPLDSKLDKLLDGIE